MSSWLNNFRNNGAKKVYHDVESSHDKDPFSDVGFYGNGENQTENYTGGIAPVTISLNENDGISSNRPRSWESKKKDKPMAMFVDQEGQELPQERSPPRKVGNGDIAGEISDLDFCCIKDGAIECLGFDKVVVCSGEDEEVNEAPVKKSRSRSASWGKKNKNKGSEETQVLNPTKSHDESTAGTRDSHQLDTIRGMGPIADRDEKKGLSHYFSLCSPDATSKQDPARNRRRTLLLLIGIALLALISGIVGFTLSRQSSKGKNATNQITTGSGHRDIESQLKNLLDLTPSSVWDSQGSPQSMAMQWIAYEDTAGLSLGTTASAEEIKERFAAAALYFATYGPEKWKAKLGFLGGNSICDWNTDGVEESFGIFCGQDGRVSQIRIVDNNLHGSLPNELNYFSEMVLLNLYFNKLTGTIPDLSELIKVEQIDLDGNTLSGNTPESLFKLPNIMNLLLLNNKRLTGTIPEFDATASKLSRISLQGCSFVGSLPASLGGLVSLRLLQLKDNKFNGEIPLNLMSLPRLEILGLDGNRLSGRIPSIRLTFEGSALTSLNFGSNQLEGSLPNGLERLSNLKFFYADDNMLTGQIRDNVMLLPKLEQLWLQNNEFSGDVGYFLSESNQLEDVNLGDNDFSGDLQDFLRFAPSSIKRLDLSRNRGIEGFIPREIELFGSLRHFNASSCNLGGQIPEEIGRLNKLESLDLSTNHIQGTVPFEMANLQSLTTFDISRNRDLGGDLSSSLCETVGSNLLFGLSDCSGAAEFPVTAAPIAAIERVCVVQSNNLEQEESSYSI
eukprot:CAMPEP_0197186746 /NCGR_PEP_ID=MMETSP1423-20130617/14504_1 /TAXON_ID=476441 /ORGANISM="Pseudo-nitzschia heimii, Strain UNC1101" /LENGTH=787 /DNA_ID=CAMNT_0042638139 /DNA_START=122 /DNA_END=2486 /DNA_ORIENTATION=+